MCKIVSLAVLAISFLCSTTSAFADREFIRQISHTDRDAVVPWQLYRITNISPEIEALPDPDSGNFEYFPHIYNASSNTQRYPYPDFLRGYMSGSDAAKQCMKLSWHIWQYTTENPPENLKELMKMKRAPYGYIHWNNDYTNAAYYNSRNATGGDAYRSFWHFSRPGGALKWISSTLMDGSCEHPTVEAIDHWAACEIKHLKNTDNPCPRHR